MTTPERLRRRQRFESAFIVVLTLLLILGTYLGNKTDREQSECLTEQVQRLTKAVNARSQLANRSSESTTNVILTVAKAKTQMEYRDALDEFIREQQKIQELRRKNPVPAFPTGACE